MATKNAREIASFEKAYGFYRKKNDKAALGVIKKLDISEPRVMELKAQILYRMEEFQEAFDLLKKLIRTHSDEFDDIRRANLIAVKARLEAQGNSQELDLTNLDSFEQFYNSSCHLIACEKFAEALKLLDKAIAESKKVLTEDGLKKEEIELEISPILAQKAFVLQKIGNFKDSIQIYRNVLKIRNLQFKLKSTIEGNMKADFVQYGKKWRPRRVHGKGMDANSDGELGIEKPKKKKKVRLPTNCNPEIPPDPERWLPRQERSAYRKKLHKKFKDREVGRGTQGAAAAVGTSANMDYSTVEPSPHASPKPTEGPRQQRPTQQAKKNKKKKPGGKW